MKLASLMLLAIAFGTYAVASEGLGGAGPGGQVAEAATSPQNTSIAISAFGIRSDGLPRWLSRNLESAFRETVNGLPGITAVAPGEAAQYALTGACALGEARLVLSC